MNSDDLKTLKTSKEYIEACLNRVVEQSNPSLELKNKDSVCLAIEYISEAFKERGYRVNIPFMCMSYVKALAKERKVK